MKPADIRRRVVSILHKLEKRSVLSLVVRVARELGEDSAGDMAGSIAYYAILSVFPLLLGVIALLGLFLPSEMVQTQIFQFAERYIPGSDQLIERNISSIIELRGTLGVASLIGLFWTGSALFGAVGRVINRAWDIHTYRPFYLRKLRDLVIAVATSFVFFLSMATTAFSSIIPIIDFPVLEPQAIIASRIVGLVLIFIVILLVYKFMPNTKTSWRYIWPGAILAAVLFEIARTGFTFYLDNFASYDMVYGSVATAIVLLVWIYLSAFIIIIGAEFSSEYGRMRQGFGRDGSPSRASQK